MYNIKIYETIDGNRPFEKYMQELLVKYKKNEIAKIKVYIQRLEEYGLDVNNYHPNTRKKIQSIKEDIHELRPGNSRIFFFCINGDTFILLHGFTKKAYKTPKREIDKAIQEYKDYKRRIHND